MTRTSKVWGYNRDPKQMSISDGASDLAVAQNVFKSHIIMIKKMMNIAHDNNRSVTKLRK